MPAAPSPAIALPQIKAAEFGATAQMREPSSKIPIALTKTHFMGVMV